MASRRVVSPRRLHRHQPVPSRRTDRCVLQRARHGRTMDQMKARTRSGGRGCPAGVSRPMPSVFSFTPWPTISATSCGPWPYPSPVEPLVFDDAAREAGEGRRQGGSTWPLRDVPTGRCRRSARAVRRNPRPDRPAQTKACTGMSPQCDNPRAAMTGEVRPNSWRINRATLISDEKPVIQPVEGHFHYSDASPVASQRSSSEDRRRARSLRGESRFTI